MKSKKEIGQMSNKELFGFLKSEGVLKIEVLACSLCNAVLKDDTQKTYNRHLDLECSALKAVRKAKKIFDDLKEQGFTDEELDKAAKVMGIPRMR